MEILEFLTGLITVVGAAVIVIRFVNARTGVGIAWLISAGLIIGVVLLLFQLGMAPLATLITLASGAVSSFRFYRERSVPVRILIAVIISVLLIVLAGLVYLVIDVIAVLLWAILEGILISVWEALLGGLGH